VNPGTRKGGGTTAVGRAGVALFCRTLEKKSRQSYEKALGTRRRAEKETRKMTKGQTGKGTPFWKLRIAGWRAKPLVEDPENRTRGKNHRNRLGKYKGPREWIRKKKPRRRGHPPKKKKKKS